mgnify:CR=1 FL=1
MITKEKIIEVFNYYAVGSFNIEITEDNLKLFAKEIEALSKVNNVVLDDVIKCEHGNTINPEAHDIIYCRKCWEES